MPRTEKEIDIDNVEVLLQVLLPAETIHVSELNQYTPGSELRLRIEPGSDVGIAINGRVLGQGKLVDLNGVLGVRVTGWHV